ncbi:acyl-CoA/acyl-ACP dehydrogenase [Microaerobacter geothermalis]|uniref:acyl-CoA dehydrogenase family protein n=1 Tax=Microaerobacter geothermalis TaxID=674972 RepID=UPI001F36D54B|nr:acyl-CoA dehydrogenase family protein [Microaerobacter geothermalis]MCF6093650.1 acyl-CoA/acyl-ACP dehydrogenase [Microaerobacter geothermalis]
MYDFLLDKKAEDIREEARRFVKDDVPRQMLLDMDSDKIQYPRSFIEKAAKNKLLGIRFPKEYGGRGLNWVAEVAVLEEIGVLGSALGCLYSLPSIVGEAISKFGSEELKRKFLIPTLEGRLTCAEALTEPRGGSDFFGTTTYARKEGSEYILNGQKRFVVGAEGADYFLVYARTNKDAPSYKGISAFIVPRGEGVRIEYAYGLMGSRGGGAGRVHFKDCRIPEEYLVGKENEGGVIFYQMMIPERLTSAAGALGMARAAIEVASDYSTKRKAFGQKIKEFQGVNFKVADSITQLDAARGIVYLAAKAVDSDMDSGKKRRLVSEAKKFATDTAWNVVNHAMQIMGGIGYTNVYPVERLLRDIRLTMIWTGTNEIMNLIIQHEWYKELASKKDGRNLEWDAAEADKETEKIYE